MAHITSINVSPYNKHKTSKNDTAIGISLDRANNDTATLKSTRCTMSFLAKSKNFLAKLRHISTVFRHHTTSATRADHTDVTATTLLSMGADNIKALRHYAENLDKTVSAKMDSTIGAMFTQLLDISTEMYGCYLTNKNAIKSLGGYGVGAYLDYITKNTANTIPLVTFKEFIALRIYSGMSYVKINSGLRENTTHNANEVVNSLQSGINKLSENKLRITFRGEGPSDLKFTEGEEQTRLGLTSTSSELDYAFKFITAGRFNVKKILYLIGKNSANTQIFAAFPLDEREYLYPANSKFTTIFKYNFLDYYSEDAEAAERAQQFIDTFAAHREDRLDDLVIATYLEMDKEGKSDAEITAEIKSLRAYHSVESLKVIDLLKSGISFVVLEETGLPATAGRQGYAEALDLAKLQHPPHRPDDQEDIAPPPLDMKRSPPDFLPGVGPLEGNSAPVSGIPVEYLYLLRKEYAKDSQTHEYPGLNGIRNHSQAVVDNFLSHFATTFERDTGFTVEFMVNLLALHDIGKGLGPKSNQHANSKTVIKTQREAIALGKADSNMIADIIAQDPLGEYFQELIPLDECVAILNNSYEKVLKYKPALTRRQYFELMTILYRCDAGSYPGLKNHILNNFAFKGWHKEQASLICKAFLASPPPARHDSSSVTRFHNDRGLLARDVRAWLDKYQPSLGKNPAYRLKGSSLPAALRAMLKEAGLTRARWWRRNNVVCVFSRGAAVLPDKGKQAGLKRKHFVLAKKMQ